MDSDLPLILRSEVIRLSAMAAYDSAKDNPYTGEIPAWENNDEKESELYEHETKRAIEKFCELEGIKQEFKGNKYRLIGSWREP